jgi:hypothetical protein
MFDERLGFFGGLRIAATFFAQRLNRHHVLPGCGVLVRHISRYAKGGKPISQRRVDQYLRFASGIGILGVGMRTAQRQTSRPAALAATDAPAAVLG